MTDERRQLLKHSQQNMKVKSLMKRKTGFGIMKYSNNSKYQGQWRNNLYHGKGILYLDREEDEYYEGDFYKDKKEGFGIYRWKNGDLYKGQWKNNMKHGKGTLFGQVMSFQGTFINDKREGAGVCLYNSGDKYDGEWKNDVYHGLGKEIRSNGDFYEGFFVNGLYDGYGVWHYKNGDIFERTLNKENKIGNTKLFFVYRQMIENDTIKHNRIKLSEKTIQSSDKNNDSFIGKWEIDMFNDTIFTTEDIRHEIIFHRSNYTGQGRAITFHGNIYHGLWKNGMKEGFGVKFYLGGARYEGHWGNNKRNGEGKIIDQTGTYVGNMKDDMEHGLGTKNFSNNDIYKGEWNCGAISGKGTMKYRDGSTYEGNWLNSKKHGIGKYIDIYSIEIPGKCIDDKFYRD